MREIKLDITPEEMVKIIIEGKTHEMPQNGNKEFITSKELAEAIEMKHGLIFKQMASYLCTKAPEEIRGEFVLTSFWIHQGREYPMYKITEKGCVAFADFLMDHINKNKSDKMEMYESAVKKRFHPEKRSDFLLEGRPRTDYETYCEVFNSFISGPGSEGREIAELSERYKEFYRIMKEFRLSAKDSNEMETAMYNVAIEAEMQGFIYGLKLFEKVTDKKLQVA